MGNKNERQSGNGPQIPEEPFNGGRQPFPPYEFYEKGVNEAGWFTVILAFMENRTGGEVVAVVAILALFGIAKEFIRNRNDDFDGFALAGCLVSAAMIFALGLLAILRATKTKYAEETQEKQGKTQPEVGDERENENGATPR